MTNLSMRNSELFGGTNEEQLTIEEVANLLNVSTASVRNWIKTGYLVQLGKNMISKTSFDEFEKDVIGYEKLTNRANKSQKDLHDHDEVANDLRNLINDESVDSDTLGYKYEESLSNSYRNKEGVYYTPERIVSRFF